jgi:hypothetical protein
LAQLRRLNLAENGLLPEDMERLADCPFLAGLTSLHLGGNQRLADAELEMLARSKHLARLVYLNHGGCPVTSEGVAAFVRSPNAARLRVWILGSFGDPGFQAIAESPFLGKLTTLLCERGSGSGVHSIPTATGATALAHCTKMPNLAVVDRSWSKSSETGLWDLLKCERLAWHGRSNLSERTPALQQAHHDRFGTFCNDDLYLWDPVPLFPWARHTLT